MSEETKAKISKTTLGVKKSPEMRRNLSTAKMGKPLSDYHRSRLIGRKSPMEGKRHKPETIAKMRKAAKGRIISEEQILKMSGANNWNWKGGVTPFNKKIRMSKPFKEWRKAVFCRDNYKCVLCDYASRGTRPPDIHADHIKPFAFFPELRFDLDNGRTLCVPCHQKSDTWGHRTTKKYGI